MARKNKRRPQARTQRKVVSPSCYSLARKKQLPGRTDQNCRVPTQVDRSKWTQDPRRTAHRTWGNGDPMGRWVDPPYWRVDQSKALKYHPRTGEKLAPAPNVHPAYEHRTSANRVVRYDQRPIRHASEQMNRLSYGDMLQHGIMQERE